MMREVFRLDYRHENDLKQFLLKNRGLDHVPLIDTLLRTEKGIAIACTEDNLIKQVLICQLDNTVAVTKAIYGPYDDYSIDILDSLCALCSMQEPIVALHEFTVADMPGFMKAFSHSRLGKMAKSAKSTGNVFSTGINYPAA